MLHTYREDLLSRATRSERLATFGQLVGSIGHELRNPLGVIESSLFLLRGRAGDDDRVKKHLDRIGEQVRLSNQIISGLLDMVRDRPLPRETRPGDGAPRAGGRVRRAPARGLADPGRARRGSPSTGTRSSSDRRS